MDTVDDIPVIFTPDNEPYLGLKTLHAFDNAIVACMRLNAQIAPLTHSISKDNL